MPILGLPYLDSFTYTENPLGSVSGFYARWDPTNRTATMQADGSAAVNNGDGNLLSGYYIPNLYGPDCAVFATWMAASSAASEGPAFGLGLTTPNLATYSGYVVGIFINVDNSATLFNLYRIDAGAATPIGATQVVPASHAPGTEYGVARQQAVFTFYRNGSAVGTPIGESTYTTAGAIGFVTTLTATVGSGTLDNLGGGTLGGVTGLTGTSLLTGAAATRVYGTVLVPLTP